MSLNASNFIRNRTKVLGITNKRIHHIIWYIIECYLLLRKDNPTYSKAQIKNETTHKLEDYFKMELVDNYLTTNKRLLQEKLSALEQINFAYEPVKRFIDIDQIEKSDKIDIYINKLGLQKEWRTQDENIYFAIECKRIKVLSDTKFYIEDIEKFANRNHKQLRIPFEGMIAFVESNKLTHQSIVNEINKRLTTFTSIITNHYLNSSTFHNDFDGSYTSIHLKNYSQIPFSIFHLVFDYSDNVVD